MHVDVNNNKQSAIKSCNVVVKTDAMEPLTLGDGFKDQSVGPTDGGEWLLESRVIQPKRECSCGSAGSGIKCFLREGDGVLDQRRQGRTPTIGLLSRAM
uniref:Uncharacterized protein n=1 Tax=Romanomermis culicivorax TaxID=13658 RepID=A0A915L065_ROMCU